MISALFVFAGIHSTENFKKLVNKQKKIMAQKTHILPLKSS